MFEKVVMKAHLVIPVEEVALANAELLSVGQKALANVLSLLHEQDVASCSAGESLENQYESGTCCQRGKRKRTEAKQK